MSSSFQDQRPWIIAPSDDYSSTLCGLDGGLCFGNTTGWLPHSTDVLTESSLFQPKTIPQTFIAIRSTPLLLLLPAPFAYMRFWLWMIGKLTWWASTRVLLPFIIQSFYSLVADTWQQRAADAVTQLVYNTSLKHTIQLQASDPLVALWSLDSNLESALHTTQQKVSTASLIDIAGLGRSSIQLILLESIKDPQRYTADN